MKKFVLAFVIVATICAMFGWGEIRSARMSWEDRVETQERREALLDEFVKAKMEASRVLGAQHASVKVTAKDDRGFAVDIVQLFPGGHRREYKYSLLWTQVGEEIAATNAVVNAALYSV